MYRPTILFAAAWLLAMPGAVSVAGAGAKTASDCIAAAETALQNAYVGLQSPVAPGRATLEKVVDSAKPDLRKLVWGDPDVRLTTSVLEGKIRIWVNCGGKERSKDWAPPG